MQCTWMDEWMNEWCDADQNLTWILPVEECLLRLPFPDPESRVDSALSGRTRSRRRSSSPPSPSCFPNMFRTNEASSEFRKCPCLSFVQYEVLELLELLLLWFWSMTITETHRRIVPSIAGEAKSHSLGIRGPENAQVVGYLCFVDDNDENL